MATLYKAQFERAERFFKHAETLKKSYNKVGTTNSNSILFLYDLTYAFCIFCYHIRDGILQDKNNSIPHSVIDSYIKKNPCLQICQDIANSSKHFKPKHGFKTGQKPTRRLFGKRIGQKLEFKLTFDTAHGNQEFFSFAVDCLGVWEKFFANNNL